MAKISPVSIKYMIYASFKAEGHLEKPDVIGATELKKWAKEIGYDIDSCVGSGKYSDEIAKDMSDGSAAGVEGTPAFFVNGKLLSGAQPYSAFKSAIDAALKA